MNHTFTNSKGDNLSAILSNPSSSFENTIMILCHGFTSSKDSNTYTTLSKQLDKSDISSFRFDFFGHGDSDGEIADITVSEAVDDILNAIKYLKNIGYKNIGLFGSSFGGISSIMAASKSNDIDCLVLKAPVSDYKEQKILQMSEKEINDWKENGYTLLKDDGLQIKINYKFYSDFDNNNGYIAAESIKIPTLIVHGDQDKSVPVEQSIKTSEIIKNCKLEIIKGAGHRFDGDGEFERMIELVIDFIVEDSKGNK